MKSEKFLESYFSDSPVLNPEYLRGRKLENNLSSAFPRCSAAVGSLGCVLGVEPAVRLIMIGNRWLLEGRPQLLLLFE